MSGARLYSVRLGESERSISVRRLSETPSGGVRYAISIDDAEEFEVDAARPVADVLSLVHQGKSWEAGLVDLEDGFEGMSGIRH